MLRLRRVQRDILSSRQIHIAWMILVTVAVVILGTFNIWRDHDDSLKATAALLTAEARSAESDLSSLLGNVDNYLRDISMRAGADLSTFADGRTPAIPEITATSIVGLDGIIQQTTRAGALGRNVGDRDYLVHFRDKPLAQDTYLSDPAVSVTGTVAVFLALPLHAVDGRLTGVVVASIEPRVMSRVLGASRPNLPSGVGMVFNANGFFLARVPDIDAKVRGSVSGGDGLLQKHRATGQPESVVRARAEVDGVERIAAMRNSPRFPVTIGFSVAVQEALAPWRQTAASVIAMMVAVFVGAALLVKSSIRRESEQLRAQQALGDSERRYRTLTEWTPEPLLVHDGERFIYLNPAAARLFGAKSAPDLIGKAVAESVHPDFREIVRARMKASVKPGDTWPILEGKFLRLDGTTFVAEVQSTAIVYEGARVVQTAMRDVTRSKEDQATLTLQAQRSEALLALPAAAESGDQNVLLQFALGEAERLTGSQIGFVHFVQEDQETIELVTWSQATLKHYCTASSNEHLPISRSGIWADALRQRVPVLLNDYASASGKQGLPQGHAQLERLLIVPVIDGGLVRLLMGIGNKPQPYTDLDVETASLMAQALWRIVSKKQSDDAARLSQEFLKEAQHIAGLGSYVLDISAGRWSSSEELDRLFGIDASFERSVTGWGALIHPADRAMMEDYFKSQVLGRQQTFNREYRILRHDDQAQRWVHGLGQLEFDAQGGLSRMIGTIQDITERKQAESEIERLAFSDPLTGLPNRRLLMDRLEHTLASVPRHQQHGALLFIDLDNFKTLNDTLGHDKGDALLREVAKRLTACVREGDTVARLGGDEFVVLLEDLSSGAPDAAAQSEAVGSKILVSLAQPYLLDGHGHHSSASIGLTLFGAGQREHVEEPLKRCELAMYEAKTAGRNALRFFEPEMKTSVAARALLEEDLRNAVVANEFLLYYQPQRGDGARLTGAEALVRWQHPRRGLVLPAQFIPIAEVSGLILPLGRWVLRTACAQLAAWSTQPAMAQLSIAVNVSAWQLKQANFVAEVLSILDETAANPHLLKLELTESVLVENVEQTIAKMSALKARGVGFSLDDFGTGYSSLSYLKRLPLDQLKIDQGFVRDILTDANDAAIAKMVIALADTLGLSVIAEGVETEAQRDFLAALGCHSCQGYLFSPPLPLAEFEAFALKG